MPPGWPEAGRLTGDVYVDGSVSLPDDPRRRRGGWGLWCPAGPLGPCAAFGAVVGRIPTPYRAELQALLRAVEWAAPPLSVYVDNETIADEATALAAGEPAPGRRAIGDWARFCELIEGWPEGALQVRWLPAHTLDPGEQGIRARALAASRNLGHLPPGWAQANAEAGALARRGAELAVQAMPASDVAGAMLEEAIDATLRWYVHVDMAAAQGDARLAARRRARRAKAAARVEPAAPGPALGRGPPPAARRPCCRPAWPGGGRLAAPAPGGWG